jgi:lysophospholipase L1-like esterase
MAYFPIAFIAPNYRDYNDYWLKAYDPGTTTPKAMALDSAAGTTVAKLQLNADGFLKSAGGALVIPYLSGAYDLYLFPTGAEADSNTTTNAIKVADNITGVLSDDAIEVLLINDISQDYDFDTILLMTGSTKTFPLKKILKTKGGLSAGDGLGASFLVATVSSTPNDQTLNDGKFAVWQQRTSDQSSYDNTISGLSADNVKLAIDELKATTNPSILNAKLLGIAWQKFANGDAVTVVTQGDSVTAGYDVTSADVVAGDGGDLGGPTHAPITYPSALDTMLNSLSDSTVTIIKQAKSGDDAAESFARYPVNPNADVTHFMFGINDASAYGVDVYIDNMEALIKRSIAWGSGVVIHSTTAVNFNNRQEDSILYAQAVEKLAKQYNCPYFDSELVHQYSLYDGVYSDGIHFNKQGYHKLGRAVGSFILAGGWARESEMVNGYYSQQAGRQSRAIGFHKKGTVTFLNDETNSYLVNGGGAVMAANAACAVSFSFRQSSEYMAVSCVGLLTSVVFGIANIASESLAQYSNRGTDSLNRITAKSRSARGITETTGLQILPSRGSQQGQQSLLGYSVGKGWKTITFTLDGSQASAKFVSGLILNEVSAKQAQQTAQQGQGGVYTLPESYNIKFPYWNITDDTSALVSNGQIPAEVQVPFPDALRTWISDNQGYFFDALPVQVDVTKYQSSGFYRFILQRDNSSSTSFAVHTLHNTNADVLLTGAEVKAIDSAGAQQARLPNNQEDAVLILKFTNAVNAYYDITVTAQAKQGQGSWVG